jgi:molybdopterin-guanine dinucleotide biosynthesis protein A
MEPAPRVTAVVLCGGAGRRFGGDKTSALIADRTVLDHLLNSLPADWPVVCVGPERATARPVLWVREQPPGGGPVAALAAALPGVTTRVIVALGGDMPYAGPPATGLAAGLAQRLATATGDEPSIDALAARDEDGHVQPLLAAYRVEALRRVVPDVSAGVPLMRLLDGLRLATELVAAPGSLDVDTPADLDEARHRLEP